MGGSFIVLALIAATILAWLPLAVALYFLTHFSAQVMAWDQLSALAYSRHLVVQTTEGGSVLGSGRQTANGEERQGKQETG